MPKEVRFRIDEGGLRDLEEAQRRLGSPNLGTALYNAVTLLLELYGYADQGYELRRVKGDDVRRLDLPAPPGAAAREGVNDTRNDAEYRDARRDAGLQD